MVEVEERSCDLHGLRVYAHDDRFRGIASIVHMFLISRTGMETWHVFHEFYGCLVYDIWLIIGLASTMLIRGSTFSNHPALLCTILW